MSCRLYNRSSLQRIRFCFYITVFTLCFLFILYALVEQNAKSIGIEQWDATGPHVRIFNEIIWKNKTSKKILVWTTFFRKESFLGGKIKERLNSCPYNCTVTEDKQEVVSSDLLIFHLKDLFFWTRKPNYRSRDQIWLLFGLEPPVKIDILSTYLRLWRNQFNWTMSYRKDSTVFSPYGSYRNISNSKNKKFTTQDTSRAYSNISKSKTRFILALNSNCFDDARRYRLIEELKKLLNVDIYGDCGDLTCEMHDPYCEVIFSSYKFILAFENSNCRDYVTEKFWRALTRNIVPIVNWKDAQKNYIHNVPPNSYINVYDFPDLKVLAEYIQTVNNNDTLYNNYFEWKHHYVVESDTASIYYPFCELCKALHFPIKAQTIVDPARWIDDDVCKRWSIPNLFSRHWDRWMFNLGLGTSIGSSEYTR